MSIDAEYMITKVHADTGSVEVIYFPTGTRIVGGLPEFHVGPYNTELPLDANGNPISGDQLHQYLSNMCPDSILERETKLRTAVSRDMKSQELLVGQRRAVQKTSPVVERVQGEIAGGVPTTNEWVSEV